MRRGLALIAFVAALLIGTGTATATFHLTKIREVGNANPADYVELQMYAGGQTLVGGHFIRVYAANGTVQSDYEIEGDVSNGQSQRTILIARDDGPFPVAPDFQPGPTNTSGDLAIPEDGAVCFLSSVTPLAGIDCVSFGAFTGSTPSPAGAPAPPLVAGTSIHRTIAPGCPTLLESSDDTDDSAADFAVAPATPRNNSTAPTEKPCVQPDTKAPQTEITKAPKKRITKAKVKIAFKSSEAGSTFECKLDKRAFKPCDSPFRKRVAIGRHRFQVVATDKAGNADASPAKIRFRRVAKR